MIVNPGVWVHQQPPAGASVLWGHPLTQGISGLWLFNENGGRPRNLVSNRHAPGDFANWLWSQRGAEKGGNSFRPNAVDRHFALEADAIIVPLQNFTVVLGYRKQDTTNRNSSAFGVASSSLSNRAGALIPFGDGTVYWDFGGATSGTTRLTVASLTFGNDLWVFTTGPRGMEIWQNGVRRANNGVNPSRTIGGVNFCLGISGQTEGTGGQSDLADYWYMATYRRQLDVTEILDISANPYIIVSRPTIIYSLMVDPSALPPPPTGGGHLQFLGVGG